jgi:hypothetical protein
MQEGSIMDKQKAAQAASLQILHFMVDNGYIDSVQMDELMGSGDIDHINDIMFHKISVCCAIAIQEDRKQDYVRFESELEREDD